MAKFKTIAQETTLDALISEGLSEIETLRDEMQEWADNMSSNNMEHLPKYEEVSETLDALDEIVNQYSDLELPDGLPKEKLAGRTVAYSVQQSARKGRGPSRALRASNTGAMLTAAREYIDEFLDNLDGNDESDWIPELQDLRDQLENAESDIEAVSFPGMF